MPTPRDRIKSISHLRVVSTNPITNESLIAHYVAHQAANKWRPSTVRVRTLQLRRIADELAPVNLVDATEEDLLRWYDRRGGQQPETRASYASAVHGIYHWMAVRARPRIRIDDPTQILDRPRIPDAQPRPMLARHYDLALACAVSDPEMYLWLGLMGCSGLRCCEVAWMQVSDVEPLDIGGLLHVVGKGGKRRTVPAGQMLMLTLAPFLRGRGPVFTRPSDGGPHTPNAVSRRVSRFLTDVGVPAPSRAHSMRHLFGTDYHSLDPDLYRQAKIMGHGSVETTQLYTLVSPVEAARYIEELTSRRLKSIARNITARHGEVA
jgi:site-specific recombinase XerD